MSENKVKKSYGRVCCVPQCKNNQRDNKNVHFYSFPSREWETERKKTWIARVRRQPGKNGPWEPTSCTFICSAHFVDGEKSNDPRKENYNPTIFPWKPESSSAADRRQRLKERNIKKTDQPNEIENDVMTENDFSSTPMDVENNCTEFNVHRTHCEISTQTDDCAPDDSLHETVLYCWQNAQNNDASTQTYIPHKFNNSKVRIVEIQVPKQITSKTVAVGPDLQMRNGFQWFSDVKNNEDSMKQLGGVTLSFFYILLNFIKPETDGQPKYYKVMNKEDRLLLFLMKMKTGMSFTALACIFRISRKSASNIFFQVLETIFESTKTWIFWPSKEAVKESLPSTFHDYPNCRAIIDCTELRCETPPMVEQRALMYSSYKSHFTVKYLIAITPNGYISFISKGYSGRTSDCIVVNDSGFLKLIEPGDEIMADKGFPQIRTELMQKNSILIMPPFAMNPQFTREEVLKGYSIASVRIYVERCIQRVRIFKITDFVTIKMMPYIDKIMYVACMLANNKEPLNNDK